MNSQLRFSEVLDERRQRDPSDIFSGGQSRNISLYHLIDDFRTGHLLLPAHQREASWSKQKRLQYIERLCIDATPPGSFEIYTVIVDGREGPKHLNDGVQRLLTANDLATFPEHYGLTKEDADYILRFTSYPVTEKRHRSHQEALERFHCVNSNVPLTPYQLTRGTILYCMGDNMAKEWWNWLEECTDVVTRSLIRVTGRHYEISQQRKNYLGLLHKSHRQTTSMFWRFLSGDQTGIEYRVAESLVEIGDQYFEIFLAQALARLGLSGANEELAKFQRIMEAESALISGIWKGIGYSKPIENATVRWLFDVAIYRRNCHIPVAPWADFIKDLLTYNRGATEVMFIDKDGIQKRTALSLGRVKSVLLVSPTIGSDFAKWFNIKRKANHEVLETGYHHSHVLPFAIEGNGVTVPEPGLLNLARGAKAMHDGSSTEE